jgi:putative polyketide hydroxylase
MSEIRTPVLIAGGSLVGLSTALFLSHHGIPCVLVERHPSTSVHPRAVGYYPRTVELLRSVGLDEQLHKAAAGFATHRTRAGVESLAGKVLFSREELEGEDDLADLTPCRMVLLPQDRLEPILRARAEELGADLRYGVELTGFEQGPDNVTATLRADGTETTIVADYLVAADGPRSLIREKLGIKRQGKGVLSNHVSIAFQADMGGVLGDRRYSVVHVQNSEVTGIFVHDDTLSEGVLIVGCTSEESLDDFSDERCTKLVKAAIGDPGVDVHVRSRFPWDMAEQVAEKFVEGRVFLAGDAAHVIPPTGGYGANTGIGDAHNLAWKLAAVIRGEAGDGLLESYDAERRPLGEYVASQGLLELAIRSKKATPEQVAASADPLTVTMGMLYRSTAVMADGDANSVDPRTLGGAPGGRAPHVVIDGMSTLDLFGAGFVLLAGSEKWLTAEGVTAYQITDESWADAYGVEPGGAVLVRPDGIVAWRSTHEEQLADVLRAVLSR